MDYKFCTPCCIFLKYCYYECVIGAQSMKVSASQDMTKESVGYMAINQTTSITRDDVRKLAAISCIEIQESELDLLADELQAVLSYASYLKDIADQSGTCPELPHNVNVMREDETHPFGGKSAEGLALVKAAPHSEENFFVVPVILKQ